MSNCSGLSEAGDNVIYNYAASSYAVTPANPTASISSPSTGGLYAVGQVVADDLLVQRRDGSWDLELRGLQRVLEQPVTF